MKDLPTRRSSRLVILNADGRLLLFKYLDEHQSAFWSTVGGELQEGEDFRAAATRELQEETGFNASIGPLLRTRGDVYAVARSGPSKWIEQYFLVELPGGSPDPSTWTDEERSTIQEWRWWAAGEMRDTTTDRFLPDWLPDLFEDALRRPEL